MAGLEKGDEWPRREKGEDVERIYRSGFQPGCTFELPGKLKQLLMPKLTLKDSTVMGIGMYV